jgi:predicted peptidase
MSELLSLTPSLAALSVRGLVHGAAFGLLLAAVLSEGAATGQEPAAKADDWQASYSSQTFTDAEGKSHAYRLRFPDGFQEGESKKYPLVLMLHGAGERGADNAAQLKHGAVEFARQDRQAKYPCFVLVPQVPIGQRWAEVDWSLPSGVGSAIEQDSPAFAAALGMVKQWIASNRVDPDRIYVTGLSMGGYGTWYAGGAHRDLLAAIAPICGGGDPAWAPRYAGLPIWNFHGTEDKAVPISRSQEMIEALKKAGQKPEPIYTVYEGGGHDVWTETYRRDDFFEWLFAQKRTPR